LTQFLNHFLDFSIKQLLLICR